MKERGKYLAITATGLAYMLSPMTVFATDSGSAVKDILIDDRFAGAMSRITWLTEMIDNWFIQIITVTAFFIISMALLKNVLAAAYCAFPKIFDAIHEAHEEMQWSETSLAGMKDIGGKIRDKSVKKVILSIIPDIKAFTDFVDQEQTPKAYFMKAVPQMCIMVIMGIFIYNGYYRDTAATVGEAGATIVENVLGSVSPEKAVNDIFNMKSEPKNTYRNDKTIQGGFIKEISNAIYKEVKANSNVYKESAENKEQLLRICEYYAYQMTSGQLPLGQNDAGGNPFQGTDQYDLKLSNVQVTLSHTPSQSYCTQATDASRFFRYEIDMNGFIGGSVAASETNLVGKTLVVTGNLSPVEKSKETFETAVEAINGSMSTIDAGFTNVTVTVSKAQVGAKGLNGIEYCYVDMLTPFVRDAIKMQLATTLPEASLQDDSVILQNTDDTATVHLHIGNNSNKCNVTFNYILTSIDADGNVTEPQTKHGEASVSINLTE